ncbi:MAG: hypothetical protein UW68_C0025G0003 [Candidatus Collierbacteria bacterium GW2011_GWB1_44_6]|uniref:Uncharacterized protein n=2 Tax=Candidatus Collieribacteriota TaxID=1752725 RepID=A0A0G1JN38_9BACT|nr:MAG: hypothetical protein UV68_C0051G0002 [Candidatus Collierbacteria bacterium GW2011_GWC2_43_12]KKT72788.1 MAG: hypothetical protein UW68_C0025G0003 [Candidatus Collierbacteria bacterium GW2011_GWB1_44_6]
MLITDYSDQNFDKSVSSPKVTVPEILTAGMIFVLPIIFLLVLSAS